MKKYMKKRDKMINVNELYLEIYELNNTYVALLRSAKIYWLAR
jgi:hypothetical protein